MSDLGKLNLFNQNIDSLNNMNKKCENNINKKCKKLN